MYIFFIIFIVSVGGLSWACSKLGHAAETVVDVVRNTKAWTDPNLVDARFKAGAKIHDASQSSLKFAGAAIVAFKEASERAHEYVDESKKAKEKARSRQARVQGERQQRRAS